ncbi:MAG: 4a-hydroxytetrahydrobiopterin dehydratase [Planctomycetota bacterium]
MECDLSNQSCVPCQGGIPLLKGDELQRLADHLGGGWEVVDEHHLQKEYRFADFREALDFTNRLGRIAEMEGHHPDIILCWGRVLVTIFTHKVDGLTESDFILTAKYGQCWEVWSETTARTT